MFMKKIICFLVSVLFFVVLYPSTTNATSDSTLQVLPQEANLVAQQALTKLNFQDTYNPQTTVVKSVYDLNENMVAYYYQLPEHHLLISASKEHSPILVAGSGAFYFQKISNGTKLYYTGGINGYSANNRNEIIQALHIDTNTRTLTSSNNLELPSNPNALASWTNYLNASKTLSANAALSQIKLAVPLFYQRDSNVIGSYQNSACGPSTMAAITEYWRTVRNLSKLKGVNVYGSKGAMINYFYANRGGAFYGMTVSGVQAGLTNHANTVYSASSSLTTTYGGYRAEIGNNRPVALKLDRKTVIFEPDRDYAYDYHWVVGKGYAFDNFDSMIIINNNESASASGQEQYLDFYTNEPILSMVTFQLK